MPAILRKVLFALALTYPVVPAFANVITDWDAKAVAFVAQLAAGAPGQRELAMVHVAMFDAVNSIERRYRPYLFQLTAPKTASQEAAAATAASSTASARSSTTARASDGLSGKWW